MSDVTYLKPEDVIEAKTTEEPRHGRNANGYGRKIPTRYLIKLSDKRWRRVYVVCYSNSGTAYIETKDCKFLCISRAEHRIKELAGV